MLWKNILGLLACSVAGLAAVGHQHSHERLHRRQNETVAAANSTDEYDYIVVGSGAGGGPLAARLALAGYSVLVLDAGDDINDIYTNVPALHFTAAEYLPMQWNFYVNHYPDLEEQRRDTKMTWRTPDGDIWVQILNGTTPPEGSEPLGILYPRSGVVGGCTQHHAQIMVYPHASDWQHIVDTTGDDTWDPEKMRDYFVRLEKAEYLNSITGGHGFKGWMATSLTDLQLIAQDLKVASLVLAAASAMGKSLITSLLATVTGLTSTLAIDLNNPSKARDTTEGMYQVPLSINALDKTRSAPRDWLYKVIADGYPLTIQTQTLVTKINFDTTTGDKPHATGVSYLHGQSLYRADPRAPRTGSGGIPGTATARREVIISGGTFNTPQILKLSGIGPAEELAEFDIPTLIDLPGVGTNMQDRYEIPVIGKATTDFSLTKKCTFQNSQPDGCLDAYNNPGLLGKGVYGTSGAAFAVLQKSSSNDIPEPDLFMSGWPANFVGYFDGYSKFALQDKRHWAWLALKAHTRNRAGTVKLRSNDPRDTPLIDFNYFHTGDTAGGADEKDLQALYDGIKFGRDAFDKLIALGGSGGFPEVQPGDNVTSEADIKQYIKDEAWGHHASCSCPIGADDDPMAVLDSKFRVRGAEGLRVVDASVFPKIPG
ncbi:uncharacterized protein HMPREF1541_02360 [Cyphellophora europaea CBS 101466]|uniref:Glucose-methanol-choline oxidoreductase N-terminal domain-containing protein n=1 Tax=Cyphellophora europaea (strain CBS 101466) TaxID=1220924 RepID=W2S3A9_CYPE1|nr:uncharacterized protein HMPREF1541_02360 [Cyphellophora europaea CBS 101466]ETN43201.1 hypothetical protein HMPREF1541_02360 [Cyphellophora europaea CBS 101466]